jgi:hypothetical protein
MVQRFIATLPARTGHPLQEWIELLRTAGPADPQARRDWLRRTHHLDAGTARWIAEHALGRQQDEGDPAAYLEAAPLYVEAMFSGTKARLRPLYDALLDLALGLGQDVRVCPARDRVPFYRNRIFAMVVPAARSHLDLGLALGTTRTPPRLLPAHGRKRDDRLTHRVPIARPEEIDADLRRWLRIAYELGR